MTNPVRRGEHQIKGHWEVPQMIKAFEHHTGIVVEADELHSVEHLLLLQVGRDRPRRRPWLPDRGRPDLHHPPTWLYRAMFRMIREAS